MSIFASVIDKMKSVGKNTDPRNPYEIALYFCLEQLHEMLAKENQQGKKVHVVFESRGRKEDAELESEFRRITSNGRRLDPRSPDFRSFDFLPVFVPKAANSSGLQLADLTARPIALSRLRPDQSNRAYEVIKNKMKGIFCFP